jgi:hypothetical protein
MGVAYPISEDEDGPFVASATPQHEPEIILTGLTQRRTCYRFEPTKTIDEKVLEIPDAARTITWNDPLYENNPDIIAVFDINSKTLGDMYEWQGLLAGVCLLLLMFFIPLTSESDSVYWWFLWVPVAGSIFVIVHANKEKYKVERLHVAVARHGVYLDETDEPGSSSLAKRTVLEFDSIVSCRIHDTDSCASTYYSVVIVTQSPEHKRTNHCRRQGGSQTLSHNVTGLLNGQVFVDLVSAMMERAEQASSNTGPSSADNVKDTTSAEMV